MIRVLLVEDSATMRNHLRESLAADPELQVVGEAVDGGQAVELVRRLRPDVVTMDMMLPTMSGLVATEHIMAEHPTPILVVSSADRQELFSTYNALAAGAVDVLEKPRGDGRARSPTCCGPCRRSSTRRCCACSTSPPANRSRWRSPTGWPGRPAGT